MSKREIVKLALENKSVPYVPWNFAFTKNARDKLEEYYGRERLDDVLNNHLLTLGSPLGFFEDLGNERYRDVFGVVWNRTVDEDIGDVEGCVLPEPTLENYEMPDPLQDRFFADIPDKLKRRGDAFRLFCVGFSLYERAWTLRGMTNLLMDFYDNPDFVRELFGRIVDYNLAQVERALEYDIDGVYFGDDWGKQQGLIMGYDLWKEFIYPELERMYGMVKDHGKYVFIHSCGDVDELFDDLIDIGLDCFNPFQPEVMDPQTIYQQYGDRLAFWGGISTQRTLPYGTPEEVRQETRQLIEMGRDGSYILAPAHDVEGDVPVENMVAFIEEAQKQI